MIAYKTDLSMLREIASYCQDEEFKRQKETVRTAILEIERLRASQFRWIPMSERLPKARDEGDWNLVLAVENHQVALMECQEVEAIPGITHWAPIPPLPEKSQEQKDLDLAYEYVKEILPTSDLYNASRHAFLAGLKAARESK